jgi:3-oxosteroid 1-dehydrogenase
VVGDAGPSSTPERREAFLTGGSAMISFLQSKGVQLVRCPGYSDYYPDHAGGNAAGRAIESVPWDARQLGDWQDKINPGMARGIGLVVKTNEVRHLPTFTRSPKSFAVATQVWTRTRVSKLRGQDLLTNGMGLIGQMTKLALDRGISVRLNSPVEELIVEDGRVAGVQVRRTDRSTLIQARRGVLLDAGGFERNPEMRRKYSRQPNEAEWTFANLGNTGDVLAAAMDLGAKTDLLDEAWWNPVPIPELFGSTLTLARQYPRTILVNRAGERFANESNSYVEVGIAMYEHDAVPAWLIFDDEYRRRYPLESPFDVGVGHEHKTKSLWSARPGRMPQEWLDKGWIKKSDTLEGLARQIGVDPDGLVETVRQFNIHAVRGQDPKFGRGKGAYNAALGDPGDKVNPAVGPLDKPPFYATAIYPGDVGTCGGVVCNEFAQVLDEKDSPIPGLYATGNMTATVMGRTYPGAGASIANSMTFGWVAARHVAGLPIAL